MTSKRHNVSATMVIDLVSDDETNVLECSIQGDDKSIVVDPNIRQTSASNGSVFTIGTLVQTPYGFGQITFPDNNKSSISSTTADDSILDGRHKKRKKETRELIAKVQLTFGIGYLHLSSLKVVSSPSHDRILCLSRMMFNDNLINSALDELKHSQSHATGGNMAICNTILYDLICKAIGDRNLTHEAKRQRLLRLFKSYDMTNMTYFLIPVCNINHWSLLVICNLHLIVPQSTEVQMLKRLVPPNNFKESYQGLINSKSNIATILHIDPARYHHTQTLFRNIRKCLGFLLFREANATSKTIVDDTGFEVDSFCLPGFAAPVSNQVNNYDCGPLLIHHCESFVREPPLIDGNFIKEKGQAYFQSGTWTNHFKAVSTCRERLSRKFATT